MQYGKALTTVVIIVALFGAWAMNGRGTEEQDTSHEEPAHVESIEGTEVSRVTLTQRAAERLDIQTATVVDQQVNGVLRRSAPYSAVLYESDGSTWVYTNPEPLTYIRHPVTIETIEGVVAIFTEGPVAGTSVVSVGGAMLYGTEHGVGH